MGTAIDGVPEKALEVRMAKHVELNLTLKHFEIVDVDVPEPGDGEVLVRADYVQLAVFFKDMMRADCRQPLPPWQIGDPVGMAGVGTVVRSNSRNLSVGDLVQSVGGWREFWVGPAQSFVKVDRKLFPSPVYYLSQGTTAYYGMADIAKVTPDDAVFVSGAAGGVGSLAGQIARCLGASTVIGSAGSQAKCDYLTGELGFDAAFDYHDGPVLDRLRELVPEGFTVFFDNVGGEQFAAALRAAAPHARFALCGALSGQINGNGSYLLPLDLMEASTRHIELRPFATSHTPRQIDAWIRHFSRWLAEDRLVFPQTLVGGGLANAPEAMLNFLDGAYRGNVAVQVSDRG